jgi:hypothetical protein
VMSENPVKCSFGLSVTTFAQVTRSSYNHVAIRYSEDKAV